MSCQMKTSTKKNQRVEKDVVKFGVKVTIKFGFDLKKILLPIDNINCFM